MRKKHIGQSSDFKILLLDDEQGLVDSLACILERAGYQVEGVTSPLEAISKVHNEHYDMLILDFLMTPIHGDKVIEKIREFNEDLYIILLTGHKDLAPPLETIRMLQIQGYCEKSDRFDQLLLLVEAGVKAITQMRTASKYNDGLNLIMDSISKIYQMQYIENILDEVLICIKKFTESQNALIMIDDALVSDRVIKGIGQFDTSLEKIDKVIINNLNRIKELGTNEEVENGFLFDMQNHNHSIGAMYVECEKNDYDKKLLQLYVNQVSAYLSTSKLDSLLKMRNNELVKSSELNKKDYQQIVEAIRLLIDKMDSNMRGHLDRVSYYAVKLGEILHLQKEELEQLKISGFLHDIYQTNGIDDIYINQDSVGEKKYKEILNHTMITSSIFSSISNFKDISDIIKYHHEKVDGTGYPKRLKDNEIPTLSKIISVADAFDVLTNTTQYGTRLGVNEAKSILLNAKGTYFDQEIVDSFIGLLEDYVLMEEELKHTFEPLY